MTHKKIGLVNATLLSAPLVLGIVAVRNQAIALSVASICLMFLLLRLPICRKRESLWTFFLTTITTIPINLFLIKLVTDFLYERSLILCIVKGICIYLVLLSIEQLAFGAITRIFFRRQYKLFE